MTNMETNHMKPRFLVTFTYEEGKPEQWFFGGTGAEKRATSLMNSSTRRKTDFKSASMSRLAYNGTWEMIAEISRGEAQAGATSKSAKQAASSSPS